MNFQHIREYILRTAANRRYRYTLIAATPLLGLAVAAGPLGAAPTPTGTGATAGQAGVPTQAAVVTQASGTGQASAPSGPAGSTTSAPPAGAGLAAVGGTGVPPASAPDGESGGDRAERAGERKAAAKGAKADRKAAKAEEKAERKGDAGTGQKAAAPAPPESKTVPFQYQRQPNYFYCGPASTRIAASSFGALDTQDGMARRLGTTTAGTNSAQDTTRVLNALAGGAVYRTTEVPGRPGPANVGRFKDDLVRAISGNRAVVANVIGSTVDTTGVSHSFPGGHYVSVVGYGAHGNGVLIADPAYLGGDGTYWLSADQLADWMGTKGYSA